MRSAPATFTYAFAVLVTTATLASTRPLVKTELLHELSTNVQNMQHHPVRVLFLSAFWLDNARDVPVLLLFVAISAPVEHWLGSLRWLSVFIAGHVGATLFTFFVLYARTDDGRTHPHLQRAVDVGISYGLYAIAAVLLYHLPRRWRLPYAAALVISFTIATYFSATFTDIGHLAAIGIGFACYPLTRRTEPRVALTS
jgi:hypothetical protein